jgi:homocysteine S-methyltransferase
VWPIRSYELLVRMHNEAPGMVVPEHVQERYRRAGSAARTVGGELGLELLESARERASGVYVVAPFRVPMNVLEFLPQSSARAEGSSTGRGYRVRAKDAGSAHSGAMGATEDARTRR